MRYRGFGRWLRASRCASERATGSPSGSLRTFTLSTQIVVKQRRSLILGARHQQFFDELYAIPEDSEEGQDLWFPAPAALPDPPVLFSTPVYDRGAMTLQALRQKVGDEAFFSILRTWYAEHRGGNVTTADFTALAERFSGQDLDHFFQVWLYEEGRPTSW